MEAVFERVDALSDSGHYIEAYGTIVDYKDDPNPEVQWRYGRCVFKEGEHKGSGPKHKAIAEAVEILRKNLETNPNCWNSHLWLAIALGSKDKHDSFKQQIEEAFIVREHADKCLELNPRCEAALHVIGNWCYRVASVSWMQKKAASALFAKPPEATLDDALMWLKKAEAVCPNIFNNNHLYMAKCYLDLGKKAEALEYLKKCMILTEEKKTEKESLDNVEEAKKLAKKLGVKL